MARTASFAKGGNLSTANSIDEKNYEFSDRTMSLEEVETQNPNAEPGEEDDKVPEEEVTVVEGWAPSVTLEVKENISTGEEEEETLFTQRSKLLRYEL